MDTRKPHEATKPKTANEPAPANDGGGLLLGHEFIAGNIPALDDMCRHRNKPHKVFGYSAMLIHCGQPRADHYAKEEE